VFDWRKARLFLELRQADVASVTGVSVERLSRAERGLLVLNDVERASLERFLKARLQAEFEQAPSGAEVFMEAGN
jgi:transcriptional regulator with XRE-family HTH domain